MKVRVMIGATGAYLCINEPGKSLDVLLAPGMSAQKAGTLAAKEMLEQAARLIKRAQLIEAAVRILDEEEK